MACPALQYISTLSHNGTIFWKQLLNTIRVFWFPLQILSTTFLILRRTERDITKNICGFHMKYPYSCQILMKFEFSRHIFEKYLNIKFRYIRLAGGEFFYADRWTDGEIDVTKLIVVFRNLWKRVKLTGNVMEGSCRGLIWAKFLNLSGRNKKNHENLL